MTGKEAIRILEEQRNRFMDEYVDFGGVNEAFRKAIDLLKEREPVEPRKVQIKQAGPLYFRCYCQRCGNHVGNIIGHSVAKTHSNFCDRCGQTVKWDD